MATIIPRTAGPQQQLQATPGARNTTQVDLSPMTQGIRAVQSVAMDIAQKEKERADTTALMTARAELSQVESEMFDPGNADGIAKYKGINALGAEEALLPRYDQRAADIRGRLTRDQQDAFDRINFANRDQLTRRIQGDSSREYELATRNNQKAALDNLAQDSIAAGVAGDYGRQATIATETLAMYRRAAIANGEGNDMIVAGERALASQIHAGTIEGIITRDPFAAQAYYERYADQLSPEHKASIERALHPVMEDAQAESIADGIEDGIEPGAVDDGDTAEAPRDAQAVQSQYAEIAGKHGFTITSTVRGVINAGAGARSQHPYGTAADFRTRDKTKEQGDALIADLRAAGYEVIDERDGKTGTGPHIHAELPPRRAQGATREDGARSVVRVAPPANEADALERAQAIRDPRLRSAVTQKLRTRYQLADMRRAEADRQVSESVNLAVENADPATGLSLRQLLTGSQYATAAAKGWIPALEARWKARQLGDLQTSSPTTLYATEELVYRAARGGEGAIRGLATLNVYDPTLNLSLADRQRLAKAQADVLSGKPDKVARVATEGEISGLIKSYRTNELGIKKDDDPKAIEFDRTMRSWVSWYANKNGRDPTYDEVTKHADSLVLQGDVVKPGLLWDSKVPFRVAELGIPPQDLEQIKDALTRAGRDVTAENIAAVWRAKETAR